MPKTLTVLMVLTLLTAASSHGQVTTSVFHDMNVVLDLSKHALEIRDQIGPVRQGQVFALHGNLSLKPHENIEALPKLNSGYIPIRRYRILNDREQLSLQYQGSIHHDITMRTAEYARSMQETPGLISQRGVYLANSSFWYPRFEQGLVRFKIQVSIRQASDSTDSSGAAPWRFMSQGAMKVENGKTIFLESNPQEEIYLVAGRYHEYTRNHDKHRIGAYLLKDDRGLANQYLDVTGLYIDLYSKLLGPYPYDKFYMVENFWDTGYGMPSFTLLGSTVIRLPFILHSSYPHEILHNWWGNGVYTDYVKGNWAEGLTNYLSDHLIAQQRKKGWEYRRTTLQRYTDYVGDNKDFPITQFTSRHSSASQAVGYGKTMMLFHMLRQRLGDKAFVESLRQFYRHYSFKTAGFDDLQKAFQQHSNSDLSGFFRQWLHWTGAPQLRLRRASVSHRGGKYTVTVSLAQVQKGQAYELDIPLAIQSGGGVNRVKFHMNRKRQTRTFALPEKVSAVKLDPDFDIFRRLHRLEIPPALSKVFGAGEGVIVLPAKAPADVLAGYRQLAKTWQQGQESRLSVVMDNKIQKLPVAKAVWIFGWENRFRSQVDKALKVYGVTAMKNSYRLNGETLEKKRDAAVMVARHPSRKDAVLALLASQRPQAHPGLARKLPHYGKYSYLGFRGDAPQNNTKGQWQVRRSPMQKVFAKTSGGIRAQDNEALAYLPSGYSREKLQAHVRYLAAKKIKGRGLGTPQLDEVADYIAQSFANAGLKPLFGDYRQRWRQNVADRGEISMTNVVAVLPGSNPKFQGESVVVAAHYDHLGQGWPEVRESNRGKVHPGADDNASGVAVMLEFAASVAKTWKPQRAIVFIAFTGEEAGHLGSSHYVKNPPAAYPANKVVGMINLDTVGRLQQRPLQVFATGSAREWIHIFHGVSYVTGVATKTIAQGIGSSDEQSFLKIGVPAVHLFSGTTADYHHPTDTMEKVDFDGMIKVTKVVKETVEHLANRDRGLHVQISGFENKSNPPPAARKSRHVSLGTIPDFSFAGEGVKLSGVRPDSPAAGAGLKQGDVIIAINEIKIENLRGFARYLRELKAGDRVKIKYLRDRKMLEVNTRVVAR